MYGSFEGHIKPEGSLFRYPGGQSPSDYDDTAFQPIFWSPNVYEIVSKRICDNVTQCVYDLELTGNTDVVVATREAINCYRTSVERSAMGRVQSG